MKNQDSKEDKDKQLKAIYSDIEFVDIMEAVCSDARNYVSDNPGLHWNNLKNIFK